MHIPAMDSATIVMALNVLVVALVIGLYRLIRYAVRKELQARERRRGGPPERMTSPVGRGWSERARPVADIVGRCAFAGTSGRHRASWRGAWWRGDPAAQRRE
jgi:hypothetical protein